MLLYQPSVPFCYWAVYPCMKITTHLSILLFFFYLIMSLYKWKTCGYKHWIFESNPYSVQSQEPQIFVNGALTPTWTIRHIVLLLVVTMYSSIISTSIERKWEEHWPESQETWVLRALPPLSNVTGHFISRPQFLHQENGLVGLGNLSRLFHRRHSIVLWKSFWLLDISFLSVNLGFHSFASLW